MANKKKSTEELKACIRVKKERNKERHIERNCTQRKYEIG
jgi:hypothetical protein